MSMQCVRVTAMQLGSDKKMESTRVRRVRFSNCQITYPRIPKNVMIFLLEFPLENGLQLLEFESQISIL